jgi:hypothetical protein
MAKFRLGSTAVFTIATNAVPCPTSFSMDRNMDVYVSECATGTVKEHVLGDIVVSGSFSGEIAADGVTALTYIAPKVSGALLFQPAGNGGGNLQIVSSDFKITSRSLSASTTGLTTYTCNFVMNQITVSAI